MSIGLDNWAKKYEEATNSDETIGAMAKYYTCSFMFDMESAKVIIEMHDGKIKKINTKPSPLDPYDFALRASAKTWREIEGNHLVLMKNLRNFTVQFELLRKTGVPV
jgi:hypothetical protein